MALKRILKTGDLPLTDLEARRIDHHLDILERRLANRPDPTAVLTLTQRPPPRRIEAGLRVELGPLGAHLISHQAAETPDRAVRLAVQDVERQLERWLAMQRGEPAFGVPSRRPERRREPRVE